MKSWLIRAVVALAIAEIAYLAVANIALNLPYTQTLINQHKPDKLKVYWKQAWTLYPFRVHARGISANGQSGSQQWQIDIPAASASVAVLPLLQRSVKVTAVEVEDVEYFQRPRPRPDKDYADTREYFPEIRDRTLDAVSGSAGHKKRGDGWKFTLEDVRARGDHGFWIYQVRGALNGDIRADIAYQANGGPFSLNNGIANLRIESLSIDEGREVLKAGNFTGVIGFSPFVPSENKGIKALNFLSLDADVSTEVTGLALLDFYLNKFQGLEIDGGGRVAGRMRYEGGKLLPGTDLAVSAGELSMKFLSLSLLGEGAVTLGVGAEAPGTLNVNIQYESLHAFHREDQALLFAGEALEIAARGTSILIPRADQEPQDAHLAMVIPVVKVPDLRVYQRYLPDKWAVMLHGGDGELKGSIGLSTTAFNADLRLQSGDADVTFKNHRFKTDLDLGVKLDSPSLESHTVDVSGTYLRLDEAHFLGQGNDRSTAWRAVLKIDEGTIKLAQTDAPKTPVDTNQQFQSPERPDLKTVLAAIDAEFTLTGSISDLGWINLLFKNPYRMEVAGASNLAATVRVSGGWLGQGTRVQLRPDAMHVQVLDYLIKGQGSASLEVLRGGKRADAKVSVEIGDALLKRQGDEQAFVEDVTLKLVALGRQVSFDGSGTVEELYLQIPSARVNDMSVYNEYLPENAPLEFLSGEADLVVELHMKPKSAAGFVKLKTKGLRTRVDEQEVAAVLTADIMLAGGVAQEMDFDISGSSVLLDNVKVIGGTKTFEQPDWSAKFSLPRGRAVWRKPIRLQAEAEIEMQDSRPIIAMLSNEKGKHGWLEKMLTVGSVQGKASLAVAHDQIVIPYAFAGSDKIDIGAKGRINGQTHEGVIYARFGRLHGILKLHNGERDFDILNARKKFDEYSTDGVTTSGVEAKRITPLDEQITPLDE